MAKPVNTENPAKSNSTNKDLCRIVTPEFRVSYPHVFKAQTVNGKGDPKYSLTMLFSKDADLTVIKSAIKNAKLAEFGPDQSRWPKTLRNPVTDGDHPDNEGKEGYAGHWVIKATSNESSRPGLVDIEAEPIINQSDFYPGCYARAQVFARVWEFMGKKGVHFILDNVQKTRDGKSLSSKKSATEVFGALAMPEVFGALAMPEVFGALAMPEVEDGDFDQDFGSGGTDENEGDSFM